MGGRILFNKLSGAGLVSSSRSPAAQLPSDSSRRLYGGAAGWLGLLPKEVDRILTVQGAYDPSAANQYGGDVAAENLLGRCSAVWGPTSAWQAMLQTLCASPCKGHKPLEASYSCCILNTYRASQVTEMLLMPNGSHSHFLPGGVPEVSYFHGQVLQFFRHP